MRKWRIMAPSLRYGDVIADMWSALTISKEECMMTNEERLVKGTEGLYSPEFEHDNCGIGAVVSIKGIKTHETVSNALKIVENLEHRAGKDAEGKTGDGVGILLQISHGFFKKEAAKLGISLGHAREYAIGMFFFPQEELKRRQAMKMFEIIVEKEGLKFLGWRTVPTNPGILGAKAVAVMPCIMQAFVGMPEHMKTDELGNENPDWNMDFERKLFIVRRVFEQSNEDTYVPSLSSRTIVYKGMFLVNELRNFYTDLCDGKYESAIALVHSRFSTNTLPSWKRAHPYRYLVHNGEINTIRGNENKMIAREETMDSKYFKGEFHKITPALDPEGSDSARLDNALEFLLMNGMPLPLAVMILIPEPWESNESISQMKKDFYQYYATMMEPWDGPASILFTDGDYMGAVLDRNGLRPSRYYITDDDHLILSSEVGVLPLPDEHIVQKDRLHPGRMLLVDTVNGKVISDDEIKEKYAGAKPYGEWIDEYLVKLSDIKIPNEKVPEMSEFEQKRLAKSFGYTYEEYRNAILPMAETGSEKIHAMGKDTPLSVLSTNVKPLFSYFHQLFAQVTNPPIDAIREKVVTSTSIYMGREGNILEEKPENCAVLKIHNPILTNLDMLKIKSLNSDYLKSIVIPITYYKNTSLERAIERTFVEVDKAYRDGYNVMILSDRGVDENHVAIPSLLAVSAMQQHLVRTKKRTAVAVVLESGEPRDVHHFATLLGFGATAVNPYLAIDTIKELVNTNMLDKDFYAAVNDYCDAVMNGIIKIASKMGISTIQSYQGSQIFEALGLSEDLISKYFTNTVSRIGGVTIEDIERQVEETHSAAFDSLGLGTDVELDTIGDHKSRSGQEEHLYNPKTIHLLQQAVWNCNYTMFKQYSEAVDDENKLFHIRGLMDFRYPSKGISVDEVEPAEEIVKRFKTGAMSYGSISEEAHETMAIAMNRIGGKSNTGEGGEAEERFTHSEGEDDKCSAIKQVASGRFGVTSKYLSSAREIQIKMAQGAKPGEGGHLPGGKVYPWVAKTRHSTPGVGLISPPPHHDIYSIEDLAQLIYDLKNANRRARISVKLVSESGVGTIAAGVAKAGAQVILISGFDGGTGAAPRNSIHSAGLPWELGLAETHQTLIMNDLRNKVILETDGKLMTGRDVAIAAMLGAEEFGFATGPLVSMGCVMMRVCNLDTCPVGVATQNPELRKRFKGKPEYVINYMMFIAEELREHMARLGVRTVDELVGRTDLLMARPEADRMNIDLHRILDNPFIDSPQNRIRYTDKHPYDFALSSTLDEKVLMKKLLPALEAGQKKKIKVKVTNTDRSFGTLFGSEITRYSIEHGLTEPYNPAAEGDEDGLDDDTFVVECTGSGGQSFGAFIPKGLTIRLIGDSNDYLGKGLSGGKIIVKTPDSAAYKPEENIIIGNVALYGATSGKVFINGCAGERFAVRNSGAYAVVEGVGEHGCEYMTGGRVVVLGPTGKNFAAGMSGGIAYVLDRDSTLYRRLNKSMVSLEPVVDKYDVMELKTMIEEHVEATNSSLGREVLDNFEDYLPHFKKVIPHDYKRMLTAIGQMETRGLDSQQALIEAFYSIKKQNA